MSPLPTFVQQEFDDFLKCGRLDYGFLRCAAKIASMSAWSPSVAPKVGALGERRGFCPQLRRSTHGRVRRLAGGRSVARRTYPAMGASFPYELRFLLAKQAGFSLHAGVMAEPHQRDVLERLCRYISRPAVSEKRLALTSNGKVRYELKTPYRDGTTHVFFDRGGLPPLDFIARLAALVTPAKRGKGK